MTLPKISVVIPSYNQEEYIEETLLSVIKQDYPNIEIIVIDGGSSDNSVEMIKKYSDKITYWVSESDGGQTKGLIKGFNKSTGDIQCWLNSDDLLEPGTLSFIADYMESNKNIGAVYGNTTWVDKDGSVLRKHREIPFVKFIWLYTYNYIPGMSMFWRSSLYRKAGGLDETYNLAMDADLWIRFSEHEKIAHVNKYLSKMRFYPEQKNRKYRQKSDEEDMRIRKRYWGDKLPTMYAIKRLVAQMLRVGMKLFTGCYGLRYKRFMNDI